MYVMIQIKIGTLSYASQTGSGCSFRIQKLDLFPIWCAKMSNSTRIYYIILATSELWNFSGQWLGTANDFKSTVRV